MGKEWDAPWKAGAGMSKVGIGDRATPWPSFTGGKFGGANPTCATCGGRARGKKTCSCEEPDWRVKGKPLDDASNGLTRELEQKRLFQQWSVGWLSECYRVLEPGGVIKVFGATRMFHRMAAAMEEAGFSLTPEHSLEAWGFGSGFPKYLNTSKAIDQHLGTEAGSPEAARFEGWATALKPAWEPFLVGTKPHS